MWGSCDPAGADPYASWTQAHITGITGQHMPEDQLSGSPRDWHTHFVRATSAFHRWLVQLPSERISTFDLFLLSAVKVEIIRIGFVSALTL